MSGIFHDGSWYESTDMVCFRCKKPVYNTDNPKYVYQCFHCDEDLYSFEAEDQDAHYLPAVMIARPIDGITINTHIEYLCDDNNIPRIFKNQPEAEGFLLTAGVDTDGLDHFYFVECTFVSCLNCGHEFQLLEVYKDKLGTFTSCPACNGSFDIDLDCVAQSEGTAADD